MGQTCGKADVVDTSKPPFEERPNNDDYVHKLEQLQNENKELKVKLDALQQRVQHQGVADDSATSPVCASCQAWKAKYEQQKEVSENYKHQYYNIATGESDGRFLTTEVQSHIQKSPVLKAIAEANRDSKLSSVWVGEDVSTWQGLKLEDGVVTGLSLPGLSLKVLPDSIGELQAVKTLILSNNSLTAVPSSIGKMKSLTTLLLDNNNFTNLPPEIGKLNQLETLWLQDNKLVELPKEIGQLCRMERLLLNGNCLENLPEAIGDLVNLTSLWLDNNNLQTLPQSLSRLMRLQRLRLEDNTDLQQVPAGVQNLPAYIKSQEAAGHANDG